MLMYIIIAPTSLRGNYFLSIVKPDELDVIEKYTF